MVSRSNTSKRVSVNYGDLSEDMLKLAASKSNKPSPILVPNTGPFPGEDNQRKSSKNFNDEALARLSGTSPHVTSKPIDDGLSANSKPLLPKESNLKPNINSYSKSRRMSQLPNFSDNNGISKRHSINLNEFHKSPYGANNNAKPASVMLPKNSNRYSSLDGSDANKMRIVKQMLSPIDTSGSESFSPHVPSPTGLGLDSIVTKSHPSIRRKVKDIDDDDDDESLDFEYPKRAISPNNHVEKELNPFSSRSQDNVQQSKARSPVVNHGARHFRSKSVNFHSRNKSLSVKPTYSPNITSPMINIDPAASFEDIKDEYPHCIPLHTTERQPLLSLMKISPNSTLEQDTLSNGKGSSATNNNEGSGRPFNSFDHLSRPNYNKSERSPNNSLGNVNKNNIKEEQKPKKALSSRTISLFGLRNLLILLFVVNNFGLLLEYYNQYFTLSSIYSAAFVFRYNTDIQFFLLSLVLTPVYYLYTYIIEKVLYLLTLKKFNFIIRSKFSSSSLDSSSQDGSSGNADGSNGFFSGSKNSLGRDGLSFKLTNNLLPANYMLPVFVLLYLTNIFLVFAVNNIIIIKFIYNPIVGTVLELHTIICVFKIISYALANKNLRDLYFKSINAAKYQRYLKRKKRFINADGTFNVMKNEKNLVEPELLAGAMTGMELAETINTLKQRKNPDGANKNDHEDNDEELELEDARFVDQNLQPKFYEGNYYPKNITVEGVFYFSVVPTLIYQPVYPSASKVNWRYCIDKVIEIIALTSLIFYLSSEYAIPILKDSVLNTFNLSNGFQTPTITPSSGRSSTASSFVSGATAAAAASGALGAAMAGSVGANGTHGGQIKLIEILIKLANVSILIWLITYYVVFHDYLNLLAELTRFNDREFYEQWWNSGSVSAYWKMWNKVFSNFFERHFYRPLMISRERNSVTDNGNFSGELGSSTDQKVNFLIFFVMAVLQELVVGVPTGNIMGISFICIIMQSPLSILTNPLDALRGESSTVGNLIFWVSFMIGQPLCILLYYFTWNIKYGEISSY